MALVWPSCVPDSVNAYILRLSKGLKIMSDKIEPSGGELRLRKATNKYPLLCKQYANHDREDLRVIAKRFAEVFGVSYERCSVKRNGNIVFMTDDSDYYGNGTISVMVESWVILRWAQLYESIEYYQSPHLEEN
jgi:hypothetical protein